MSGEFSQAADVLAAIGSGEAEIAVQAGAQRVAVQQHGRAAIAEQPAFKRARQGRLSRSRQAGQPNHRAVVRNADSPGTISTGMARCPVSTDSTSPPPAMRPLTSITSRPVRGLSP